MITSTALLQAALASRIFMNKNPVKIAVTILFFSTTVFNLMGIQIGSNWIRIILFLIFTGGILITFIVLSSLMPNISFTTSLSNKRFYIIFIILAVLITFNYRINSTRLRSIKEINLIAGNLFFFTTLILGYFFGFLWVVRSLKGSIRTLIHCQTSVFL